ncbi:serine/threonine-protein kinase [Nonomuraea jabiensis]|uniref:serine/threonine-protein kinase n=1 Tax=Nonomuraea jabiensis TaxID=882448 RepID=UPI00344248BE
MAGSRPPRCRREIHETTAPAGHGNRPADRGAHARDTSPDERLLSGRYRLLKPLGRGGMGTVWQGRDELLARDVAIKEVALPAGPERAIRAERTRREARAAARVSHPNIVAVYDMVETAGQPWIVMELLRSRTLRQAITQDGPLSPRTVASIGLNVLEGICAVNAAGILHHDVKPDNILLTNAGRVVLIDFGIATIDREDPLPQTGKLSGTPAYIAPERAAGNSFCPESDLWSLGATLYTAVEGRPPFSRSAAIPTLAAILSAPPDPFRHAGPLAGVLAGLLRKNPATRLDTARTRRQLQCIAELWSPEQDTAPAVAARVPARSRLGSPRADAALG